tara:strand:- start:25432 stop:26358 length:927 start_codon:yes stop_codon:yes gene_type:complete
MKKTTIIFFLTFISLFTNSKAQNFAPIGATWYYDEVFSFTNSNARDFIKFTVVKDTVINGQLCSKIVKRHRVLCAFRDSVEFIYTQNDTVFFYDTSFNTFQILYDFNAQAGDSWQILMKNNQNTIDTLTIRVDSTSTTLINGLSLKTLHVTYISSNPDAVMNYYNSKIIERIGDMQYMFNWSPYTFTCDDNASNGLRCYQDSVLGYYSTGIADSCNLVITGIFDKNNFSNTFSITPNPAQDFAVINVSRSFSELQIDIYNISGKKIEQITSLQNSFKISFKNFSKGMYFISVKNEKGNLIGYQKIIKD